MIPIYELNNLAPEQILNRDIRQEADVGAAVDAVIADVRQNGDEALRRYTRQFDGAELDGLEVTAEELEAAWARLDEPFRQTLRQAAENIRAFHSRQVHQDFVITDRPGIVMGQRYTPIARVGVCVPRSPEAFPSTILMNVIPARIAGVEEIVVVTPPDQAGCISDEALVDTNQTRTIYRNSDGQPLVVKNDGTGVWKDDAGNTYDFRDNGMDVYDQNDVDYYYHGEAADVYYMPVPTE